MIKHCLILVFLPVLLTAIFMIPSEENYVGAVVLVLLSLSFLVALVTSKAWISCLLLVISMHWMQLEGITFSLYLIPLTTGIYFLYALNNGENKFDYWSVGVFLLFASYMAVLVLMRPYKLGLTLFFFNWIALFFFLTASLFKWDSKKIQLFLTSHIIIMFFWAVFRPFIFGYDRAGGPCLSATIFGVLIVVSWTIWFINGWLSENYNAVVLGLGTLACISSVILSGTRMGVIGIFLGSCLILICKGIQKNHKSIMKILVLTPIAIVILIALSYIIWNNLPEDMLVKKGLDSLISGKLDSSSLGRIGVWLTALDVIRTDTIWGIGPGNFLARNKEFLDSLSALPYVDMIERLGHAHNVYLMLLSEQGVVGFGVIFIFSLLCLFFLLRHIVRYWDGLGLGLLSGGIVMLCLGMLDVFPLYPSSLGWGAWFMAVLFAMRSEKKPEDLEK